MHDKIQTLQMEKSVLITAQNENVKIKEKVKNLEKKVNDYNESQWEQGRKDRVNVTRISEENEFLKTELQTLKSKHFEELVLARQAVTPPPVPKP